MGAREALGVGDCGADLFDGLRAVQREKDQIGLAGHLGDRRTGLQSVRLEAFDRLALQVGAVYRQLCSYEVATHRLAHDAEADEAKGGDIFHMSIHHWSFRPREARAGIHDHGRMRVARVVVMDSGRAASRRPGITATPRSPSFPGTDFLAGQQVADELLRVLAHREVPEFLHDRRPWRRVRRALPPACPRGCRNSRIRRSAGRAGTARVSMWSSLSRTCRRR